MDDEPVVEESDLEMVRKRAFLRNLSVTTGQAYAVMSGFLPPSEEIAHQEQIDVMAGWATMDAVGVLDELTQCLNWFMEVILKMNDFDMRQAYYTASSILSFSVAATIHMMEKGIIDCSDPGEELSTKLVEWQTRLDAKKEEDTDV